MYEKEDKMKVSEEVEQLVIQEKNEKYSVYFKQLKIVFRI